MQAIQKAVWYIETHLGAPLAFEEVAEASGLSRFHLSRTFAGLVGLPVVAYLRGRRLTEAARALAGGAPDILQVALAAGYGSHEAFSRAFREQFGLTPDELRARRSTDRLQLVEAIRMPDAQSAVIEPAAIRVRAAMLFAGLRKYYRFEDRGGIPSLWQIFAPHMGAIPGETPYVSYGLNLAPANPKDEMGFDYMCAVEVKSLDDLPEGLSGLRIGSRTWAEFRHTGHVSSIGATCAAAGDWLAKSGRATTGGGMEMIEFYPKEFDPRTGMGGCEVWVPVRE